MKQSFCLLCISLLIIALFSCNNNSKHIEKNNDSPKRDVNIILEKVEVFTKFANQAAQDNILNSYEISQLNDFSQELGMLEKVLVEKYSDDKKGKEDFDFYIEYHYDKIESTYNELYSALDKLSDCKNADKLELYDH